MMDEAPSAGNGAAEDPSGPRDEIGLSLQAVVLDIGLSGLAVETGTRLTPHRTMGLHLTTPEGELRLHGRVVWCFFHGTTAADTGEQVPVYRAGIEFSDVLTPLAARLLSFLEANAQVTGETRMFGRFRVANAGPVAVHSTAQCQIVGVEAMTLTVEAVLGLEPVPGSLAQLRLAALDREVEATVVEAVRTPRSDRWTLKLTVDDADPEVRQHLQSLAGD